MNAFAFFLFICKDKIYALIWLKKLWFSASPQIDH